MWGKKEEAFIVPSRKEKGEQPKKAVPPCSEPAGRSPALPAPQIKYLLGTENAKKG
jgi:hypothetical protein